MTPFWIHTKGFQEIETWLPNQIFRRWLKESKTTDDIWVCGLKDQIQGMSQRSEPKTEEMEKETRKKKRTRTKVQDIIEIPEEEIG